MSTGSPTEIRSARPDDLPALQALWEEFMDFHADLDPDYRRREGATESWADYVRSKFDNPSATLILAARDGRPVGYVGAMVRKYPPVFALEKHGFIEEIAVTERYRRQGIARRLVCAAEDWLKDKGVDRVKVNIDVSNEASQGFFRSRGFRDEIDVLLKKI